MNDVENPMQTSRRIFLRQAAGTAFALNVVHTLPSSWAESDAERLRQRLAVDRLRPQYHLMPAANWMNDPNGPIYFGGRYHMFYQYNPGASVWGDMHWAHATSEDMLHWRHAPVAIAPTPKGWDRDGVFSGCIVVDRGTPTAIYTGVLPPRSPEEATLRDGSHVWREVQCLAVAEDNELRRWKKLDDPVIAAPPAGLEVTGFRDPAVWREGESWMMALGSGIRNRGGAVLLYRSRDLRRWEYLHPLLTGEKREGKNVNPVDRGDMWECPDFFPLGDKHVLLISTAGKVWWKSGKYREQRFHPEQEGVVDWGAYYAARTMPDKQGRRILWGWIPETRPEAEYRAAGWAGAMSLPRVLSLNARGELAMEVIPEIASLRRSHVRIVGEDIAKKLGSVRIKNLSAEISAECQLREKSDFLLRLSDDDGNAFIEVRLVATSGNHELRVGQQVVPLHANGTDRAQVRIFLDGSVGEIFVNGTVAMTKRIYRPTRDPLRVTASGPVASVDIWEMGAISRDRLTT